MPGSILGAGASVAAASMQADAANHATDVQMQMYGQTRSDLLPYMQAGLGPVGNLSALLGQGGIPNTGNLPTYQPGAPYQSPVPTAGSIQNAITQNIPPQYLPQVPPGGFPGLTPPANTNGMPQAANGNLAGYSPGVTNSGLPGSGSYPSGTGMPMGAVGQAMSNFSGYGQPQTGNPMLDALRNYPGYQFAQQEGINALDRSAASRGLLLSGGQLRAVDRYGQGLADQLFPQYFNQNLQVAQLGQDAAARVGNAGSNAASGAASSIQNAGTAWGSGIAGAANQIGSRLPTWNPWGGGGGGGSIPYDPNNTAVFGGG